MRCNCGLCLYLLATNQQIWKIDLSVGFLLQWKFFLGIYFFLSVKILKLNYEFSPVTQLRLLPARNAETIPFFPLLKLNNKD